jgi:lactoylglutathione lyase
MTELLVNIDVADLERAVAFYTEGLGLELSRRLGPDIAELTGAACRVYLTRHAPGSRPFLDATSSRAYERHWTPVHLDFVVPELGAAVARAEAAGARREGGVREFPGGRYVVLADPFGNGFCVLQLVGRGYAELAESDPGPAGGRAVG